MPLNVGVIGVGVMGRNHARVYSAIDGARLAAVSDCNRQAGEAVAKEFGCKYYQDYGEMLAKEKLDAVSIVVPTYLHEKVALAVMAAGVAVLLEKPIAFDQTQAKRIIAASRKVKCRLMVGHIERFNPAVTKLGELLAQGKIGRPLTFTFRRIGTLPSRVKDINVIQDIGVHDLDLMHYLTGREPVSEFYANAGSCFTERRYDYAQMLFRMANGVSAFVECNWITPTRVRTVSVEGESGFLDCNLVEQGIDYYATIVEKDTAGNLKISPVEKQAIEVQKNEPLKLEIEHFLGCLKDGSEFCVTLDDSLFAISTANEVTNSLMKRYAVKKALRRMGLPDSVINPVVRQR